MLVAGCGYVGGALASQLVAAGHAVFGLKRRPEGLPAGVAPLAADLADRASLEAALAGVALPIDVVVYAAAADAGDDDAYRRAYVDGLRNLLGALRARGAAPRHVFFTSSTAVYAQDDGAVVDETSETAPADFRGARMLEAERVLAASGWPVTSLRLGGIYGPGRTRMIESVRSGRASIRPGPPRWGNRIHRDDAAGALAHLVALALRGEPLPPLLVGVDDEPADEAVVLRWIASQLGVGEPPVREEPAEPGARGARRAGSNKRCSNARLRATGYRFRHPSFREGYAAALTAP
ncbi:MAG: NAD(P)-dependent oxidoreductase [Proteobacteria bacterium]|nr:MAG: NAD(P)-dependent oxidoreductase [Pseudomonadota bacterium]